MWECDLASQVPSTASFYTSWSLHAASTGSCEQGALQRLRPQERTQQRGWEMHRVRRRWLIQNTALARRGRPTELYTRKQILVKAASPALNGSGQERTGLHWFPLFSVQISTLSVCCFICLKTNPGTQQMNKKPAYDFGEKWLHFPPL